MHTDYKPTVVDWIAMLSISTRLIFPKVRERAIAELTTRMEEVDPFGLIESAVKYDVEKWLNLTYRRIVTRPSLITHAEAEKVPLPIAVMLMRSREMCWKNNHSVCSPLYTTYVISSEVRRMEEVQFSSEPASGSSHDGSHREKSLGSNDFDEG